MHLIDAQRALQRFAATGARFLLTNVRRAQSEVGGLPRATRSASAVSLPPKVDPGYVFLNKSL